MVGKLSQYDGLRGLLTATRFARSSCESVDGECFLDRIAKETPTSLVTSSRTLSTKLTIPLGGIDDEDMKSDSCMHLTSLRIVPLNLNSILTFDTDIVPNACFDKVRGKVCDEVCWNEFRVGMR